MAYTYENVMMKLIILYAKYFNENLKSDVVGIIPYMVTSITNQAHPSEHPVPPVERAPVMGWHWAGGNEWNTRTDPEVGGHSLEHFSVCACLSLK